LTFVLKIKQMLCYLKQLGFKKTNRLDRNNNARTVDEFWKNNIVVILPTVCDFHGQYLLARLWCETNCNNNWDCAWHRVMKTYDNKWEFNGICGEDMIFFAFQDLKDAMVFKLTWG